MSVTELAVNRKHRILQANRLTTRICPTVILNVKGEDAAPVKIILLRRYSDGFTDTDIEQINSNAVFLHLIFKGVCPTTKAYLLAIELLFICFHYRRETPKHGVCWINQPVQNPARLKHLYKTRDLLDTVHTCTSRPSTFRPGTTSGVLFPRYMLCLYGPIPCLHCRCTG